MMLPLPGMLCPMTCNSFRLEDLHMHHPGCPMMSDGPVASVLNGHRTYEAVHMQVLLFKGLTTHRTSPPRCYPQQQK